LHSVLAFGGAPRGARYSSLRSSPFGSVSDDTAPSRTASARSATRPLLRILLSSEALHLELFPWGRAPGRALLVATLLALRVGI
jgi:hypothetical protein